MLETLKEIDTQWFLWINSHHTTALDWTMWTLSQHWSWAVVIVSAFVLLTLRKEPRRWWLVLAAIGLCFLLADQTSVLIKDSVCRLRPCHALEDVRMFHTHCGGQYGFVSSHAANAFAIIAFLLLRYRRSAPWGVGMMVAWGVLTGYSRVYLGKHYVGDVLCGAFFGVVCGLIVWKIADMIEKNH